MIYFKQKIALLLSSCTLVFTACDGGWATAPTTETITSSQPEISSSTQIDIFSQMQTETKTETNTDSDSDTDTDSDSDSDTDSVVQPLKKFEVLDEIYPAFSSMDSVFDAVFDSKNKRVYFTQRDEKKVQVLDVVTGEIIKIFTYEQYPEYIAISANNDYVYVSLPVGDHEYFDNFPGYISGINTNDLSQTSLISLSFDPYDIAVTDSENVLITGGSNQWTSLFLYDKQSMKEYKPDRSIFHLGRLSYDTINDIAFTIIYGIDSWDMTSSSVEQLSSTSSLGEHNAGNNAWANLNGEVVLAETGNFFLTNSLSFKSAIDVSTIIAAAYDPITNTITAISNDGLMTTVNSDNLQIINQIETDITDAYEMKFYGNKLVVLAKNTPSAAMELKVLEHPCLNCLNNTKPIATFNYEIESYSAILDASQSYDESGELRYRWDLDNDGQWDTQLSNSHIYEMDLSSIVSTEISLQVIDKYGLGSVFTQLVNCLHCRENNAPIAEFESEISDLLVTFDASNTIDEELSVQYKWDFNSDGIFDTAFSLDSTYSHKFDFYGTKNVTLQVKDIGGKIDTITKIINIPSFDGTFALQFPSHSVVVSEIHNLIFASERANKKLYIINSATGLIIKTLNFDFYTERMVLNSDESFLYLSLPEYHHVTNNEKSGKIAKIDLSTLEIDKFINLDIDPFYLMMSDDEHLIVTGGSGIQTTVNIYNILTEQLVSSAPIRSQSFLGMNKNKDILYSVTTTNSYKNYYSYNITNNLISLIKENPDGGDQYLGSSIIRWNNNELMLIEPNYIFDSVNLEKVTELNSDFVDAVWKHDLLYILEKNGTSVIKFDLNNNIEETHPTKLIGVTQFLSSFGLDLLAVSVSQEQTYFDIIPIGDHDLDGIPAWWESLNGMSDKDIEDANYDFDMDLLTNFEEYKLETNISISDTDNDGISDFQEVKMYFTNPLLEDTDNDGLSDFDEIHSYKTNPNLPDTDLDGFTDIEEFFNKTNPLDVNDSPKPLPTLIGNSRSYLNGYNPIKIDLNDYKLLWELEGSYKYVAQPVFSVRDVYLHNGGQIQSLDTYSGIENWSTGFIKLSPDFLFLDEEKLIVKSEYLYPFQINYLNSKNGVLDYQMVGNYKIFGMTEAGVLILNYSDNKYTLNEFSFYSKKIKWTVNFEGVLGDLRKFSSLLDGDILYIATQSKLITIDLVEGEIKNSVELDGAIGSVISKMMISDKNIIIIDEDPNRFSKAIYVFNKLTGDLKWSKNKSGDIYASLSRGEIYLNFDTNSVSNLYVFDEDTGEQKWNLKNNNGYINGEMIVTSDYLFIPKYNQIDIIDLQSKEKVFEIPYSGKLTLSQDGVLIISNDDILQAISFKDNDYDMDLIPAYWEDRYGLNSLLFEDGQLDSDLDLLNNLEEFNLDTNPENPDTDGDGINDGEEVQLFHSSPILNDTDGDKIPDYDEIYTFNTNPLLIDTDSDLISDWNELNIYNTDPINPADFPDRLSSYSESFESGFGDWVLAENNDRDWEISIEEPTDGFYGIKLPLMRTWEESRLSLTNNFEAGLMTFTYYGSRGSSIDVLIDGIKKYTFNPSFLVSDAQIALREAGEHKVELRVYNDGTGYNDSVYIDDIRFVEVIFQE